MSADQAVGLLRGGLLPPRHKSMVLYAEFLRLQGRSDEATDMEEKSAAIRRPAAAPAATKKPLRAGTYRVGGAVTAPSLISKVEPEYSELARAAKFQGTVTLYVEVGPDGLAHNVQVMRSLGMGLDQKANPGTKDGQPVTVAASIEVNFKLL